jgi:hypothetical protein
MTDRRYTEQEHQAYREKVDVQEAEEKQARADRVEKEAARALWTQDGGNASDFEKAWPGMRDEARRARIMNADRRAREAQRQRTRL